MQVEFLDLFEIEPTWLRLFEWAQVVKTNDVNQPLKSSNAKLKILENYGMKIVLKKGPAVKTLVDKLLNNFAKWYVHPEIIFWCF